MKREEVAPMYYWEIPERGARGRDSQAAVMCGDVELTWAQLRERTARLAAALLGLPDATPGRRIGILAHNGAHFPELCYGIVQSRGVAVPLNWRASAPERAAVLADSGVDLVLVSGDLVHLLDGTGLAPVLIDGPDANYEALLAAAEPLTGAQPGATVDELAMLIYSSGTTGEPKGAMHTHRTLVHGALRLGFAMRLRAGDAFYSCLPFFFAGAQSVMTAPLLCGCPIVIAEFDPDDFLTAVTERGVRATVMVPTMINRIVTASAGYPAAELRAMRTWVYGGAPMPAPVLADATQLFGAVFTQFYGQVETGLLSTVLPLEDHLGETERGVPRRLTVGRAAVGTALRLVDVDTGMDVDAGSAGEIWVRTDAAMTGYWNRPELTEQTVRDGWVRTGDIGVAEGDGVIRLVGRLKEMIITGGINVFPAEIEDVIRPVDAVRAVAVMGLPSDEWGEEVVAFVEPRGSDDGAGGDALRAAVTDECRRQLAGYKVPRRIVIVDGPLPTTASGKLAKNELRRQYLATLGGSR